MKRDIELYVQDILKAISAIETFVEGMDFEDFAKDDKTSSTVIRKFEIIGEAVRGGGRGWGLKAKSLKIGKTDDEKTSKSILLQEGGYLDEKNGRDKKYSCTT